MEGPWEPLSDKPIRLRRTAIAGTTVLLLSAILLLAGPWTRAFTPDSLRSVRIEAWNGERTHQTGLSPTEAAALLAGLTESAPGAPEKAGSPGFDLTLQNRWGRTRAWQVTLTDGGTAYVRKASAEWSVSPDPGFFHAHPGFDAHYHGLYLPEISAGAPDAGAPGPPGAWHLGFVRYDGTPASETRTFPADREETVLTGPRDRIGVVFPRAPEETALRIRDTDRHTIHPLPDPAEAAETALLPLPLPNGRYVLEGSAHWQGPEAHLTFAHPFRVERPILFSVSATQVLQGDLLEIRAYNADDPAEIEIRQSLVPEVIWYPEQGSLRAVLPTNYHTEPGEYGIHLAAGPDGSSLETRIRVEPREFLVQHLRISPSVAAATRNPEAYAQYRKYFHPVRRTSDPDRLHQGPFVLPAGGRLSTEFGETRTVNQEPTAYRHNGIDIAAPTGTPVVAAGSGRVVFSMYLILTGHTIVIDHGQGFFTVYQHLHERTAETGHRVRVGQTIGTVGSTGFSTGPHLHFTLSHFETPLEPGHFIIGTPFTKEAHPYLEP